MTESILDTYIMSLFDRGFHTAYDLHVHGKVSLGSSVPALKRLERGGAIIRKANANGERKIRNTFQLTAMGKKIVGARAVGLLASDPPSDVDSILRMVDMFRVYHASPKAIAEFLTRATTVRASLIKRSVSFPTDPTPGLEYLANKKDWDVARLRAEMKFLSQLARSTS